MSNAGNPSNLFTFFLPIFVFVTVYLSLDMTSLRGRGTLVKSLVSKMEADREIETMDRSVWYSFDTTTIESEIGEKFLQLQEDDETSLFIQHSVLQSDWLFTQLYYNLAKSFLSWFYCQTDINGLLNRGSMFVFSKQQFLSLCSQESNNSRMLPFNSSTMLPSLLDLGAGDGRPTTSMSPFFQNTFVTEVSTPMKKLCSKRGFTVLDLETWAQESESYDVISALNLFDRCDKPVSILKSIHFSLKPGGLLVVALVLPFKPYVESTTDHKPSEIFNINGETFKDQIETAVEVFRKLGFHLERWSRVPYLCEGDLNKPLYHLNNGLFLLSKVDK